MTRPGRLRLLEQRLGQPQGEALSQHPGVLHPEAVVVPDTDHLIVDLAEKGRLTPLEPADQAKLRENLLTSGSPLFARTSV